MNYYQAREIIDSEGNPSGLYRYTCENSGRVWPVGYCSGFRNCEECSGHGSVKRKTCSACDGKGYVKVDMCPGHLSKKEAEEHYKQYLLDNSKFYKIKNMKLQCEFCGKFTFGRVSLINSSEYIFCSTHSKEELSEILYVGSMISSY